MMWRGFTDAGLSPDMTLGELEQELAKLLKGRTSVLPSELHRELTGLRHCDEWSDFRMRGLLEMVGFEDHGDGLYSPILPARVTDGPRVKRR